MSALVGLALAVAVGISALWWTLPGQEQPSSGPTPAPFQPKTVEAPMPTVSADPQLSRMAGKEIHAMLEAGLKTLGLAVISTPEGSPPGENRSDEVLRSRLDRGPRGTRIQLERHTAQGLFELFPSRCRGKAAKKENGCAFKPPYPPSIRKCPAPPRPTCWT